MSIVSMAPEEMGQVQYGATPPMWWLNRSIVSTNKTGASFVDPAKRVQYEADHRLVRDADLREYCAKLIGDAMRATGGN